ncbi:unnamed protein product, partial [Callosobruchus maculatus]
GRPRSTQEDEVVLEQVAEDPSTSVRFIERRTGVSKSQAQRILKRYEYHLYHIQRVQTLLSSEMLHVFRFVGQCWRSIRKTLIFSTGFC